MSHVEMTINARDDGEDLQLMSAALAGQTETVAACYVVVSMLTREMLRDAQH